MMRLKGHVAVVTGAGRGIGRAICLALADEGADIVAAARTEAEISQTAEMVKQKGSRALAVQTDVHSEMDVENLMTRTAERFGKIDILVNCAGTAVRKPFVETTTQEYDTIMDTNVKGVYLCTKHALRYMVPRNSGRIVNISSGAGKHGIPSLAVYSASKAAVIGLTQALAYELDEIRVYALCPGGVDTGMYRSMFDDEPPLKPEDVAYQVMEMCLPESVIPTGSAIEMYR
ncbi:short-chain dehydrogenase/reductase SDR [Methanosalsum zhilinae DSM 4017]|uniref:Short-chain dehydrogenase/reductase SDR n=1 Tax=Methanosalsum zhilinae (strain DSM 4017 / NBRC 107636 / OCM 62 / WeN5) TaxID=679901 RepID=F7XPU7_METZD|nr:SDR family oxidoreductase [Methanosalsum zhilinae]AEH61468.1 short-chain dehydrogenase/reductase SDR [Methanosalsum zhilinae DSM 4017]